MVDWIWWVSSPLKFAGVDCTMDVNHAKFSLWIQGIHHDQLSININCGSPGFEHCGMWTTEENSQITSAWFVDREQGDRDFIKQVCFPEKGGSVGLFNWSLAMDAMT